MAELNIYDPDDLTRMIAVFGTGAPLTHPPVGDNAPQLAPIAALGRDPRRDDGSLSLRHTRVFSHARSYHFSAPKNAVAPCSRVGVSTDADGGSTI
jgi:hypothetical protein